MKTFNNIPDSDETLFNNEDDGKVSYTDNNNLGTRGIIHTFKGIFLVYNIFAFNFDLNPFRFLLIC